MVFAVIALVAGIVLLTWAAEKAVISAEELSAHLGISPIIVGALIVGLGTSLPEMVVSGIAAAQRDTIDLAVGNVVGSNAANLTLVLGVGAIITRISGQRSVMRREGVMMVAAAALFTAFAIDGYLDEWEGAVLLAGMVGAAWVVVNGKGNGYDAPGAADNTTNSTTATNSSNTNSNGDVRATRRYTAIVATAEVRSSMFWAIAGLVGVLIGAQLMVTGAVDVAGEFGASEAFIGLTVVAIGTSLPELATTVASARRNSVDLVVGNLIGSNLFNSLAVGGLAGLVGTGIIEESIGPSMLVMLFVSATLIAWGASGRPITRGIGISLVLSYVVVIILGL